VINSIDQNQVLPGESASHVNRRKLAAVSDQSKSMLIQFGDISQLSHSGHPQLMWRIERHQRIKAVAQVVKIGAAREADRRSYVEAQRKAAEQNKLVVQRIETQQQRITANVEADLNARLERLRRELRSTAPQGVAGSPKAGGVPQAAPADPDASRLCLEADQLLRGAENEERHEQLIRWVKEQLGVDRK
jgi:hypothetical protein